MSTVPPTPPSDTRHRILEAFSGELAAAGYLGTSLDSVAATAGIRKASLYHHFPNGKEEIFLEAASAEIERQASLLRAALEPDGSLEERLTRVATLRCGSPEGNPDLDPQIYEATRHVSDAARTQVSTAYVSGLISPVEALFAEAVASGELEGEAPFLAWHFLEAANSATPIPEDLGMPVEHRGASAGADAAARAVVALFLNGARPR